MLLGSSGCSGVLDLFDAGEMVVAEGEAVSLSGLPGVSANYRMVDAMWYIFLQGSINVLCFIIFSYLRIDY